MMAPYDVTTWGSFAEPGVHVLLGIGFGFVLERAGFGSAKKLTNQFYLNDMTVLKVMFTAIITAMVLILVATTFGLLDYDKLWINPTYLGSGIVGGVLFGVGFVVGGYCPGTALVAAATLKLDGVLFTLGVLGGIFAFGYTEPLVDRFWNDSGNFGRLTLFDWMGLPMPVVVLMAVVLALGFFAAAEWLERWMNRANQQSFAVPRRWRPGYTYAIALAATAGLMGLVWNPSVGLRQGARQARIEQAIQRGQVQIDALELADLMRDKRLGLTLLDLRDEASFNRFHLLDARRLDATGSAAHGAPQRNVKVILGHDEASELAAYRKLAEANVENVYVLARGMVSWLRLFDSEGAGVGLSALGANHPESRPPEQRSMAVSSYTARVKRPGMGGKKPGGGCGG